MIHSEKKFKHQKVELIILILFSISITKLAYTQDNITVNWMTFEEAVAAQEKQPKTIFMDMYTDWCGWCKKMDQTTFSNPNIANYLNTYFYPVKFDAETKDTIKYKGDVYVNSGQGRRPPHQLAAKLMNGRMSYPTIVFIDDNWKNTPVPGYQDVPKIEPLLVFFAEKVYRSGNFDAFNKNFESIIRNKQIPDQKINWLSVEKAFAKNTSEPKGILLNIYSKWNTSSKIMNNSTYVNPVIADYINKNYYPIKFEVESTDTVKLGEQLFINEQKAPNYPHQFPIAITNGKLFYPACIFIDKNNQIVQRADGYLTEDVFEVILAYFASDEFKNKTYEEFRKTFTTKLPKKESPNEQKEK